MDIRRFLAELKGRGVYRVAAIYAAGSWALLQVADIFFPILGLPDWAITTVLAAAAIGFPVALILAWIFDITPAGIVEADATITNFGRLKLSPARLFELGLLLTLIVLVGLLYLERLRPEQDRVNPAANAQGRASIAVLAFENLSNDTELDYFGDGLAEEILNLLARLNELNVASRTSSFYYKGKQVDLRDIGQKLEVAHVLEGSVRLSGKLVRVTAQLINVQTGYHVWSETYDRPLSDVFLIQDEISREVVNNLQVLLSPSSERILEHRPTTNPEAYDYYLRGRDYLRRDLSQTSMESAAYLFNKAIELDASYAEAYAGLCDSLLNQYRLKLDPKHFDEANTACNRALELDENAAPVYIALGNLYRMSGRYNDSADTFEAALALNPSNVEALIGLGQTQELDRRPEQAEKTFQRAIDLQPGYWHGYQNMGSLLFNSGRYIDAIPYYRRITELKPDNAGAFNNLGASFYMLNDFAAAAAAWERSLHLEPTALTYSNAGTALFFLGRYREAVDMYQQAVEYAPEDYQNWGNLGDAYRFTEDLTDLAAPMYTNALKLAAERLKVNPSDTLTLSLAAHYSAAIGNRDNALQYIARALALAPKDLYVHYNNALTLTTLGNYEGAIAALQNAVDLGYTAELIDADAGLAPLRQQQGFAAVLASAITETAKLEAAEGEQ